MGGIWSRFPNWLSGNCVPVKTNGGIIGSPIHITSVSTHVVIHSNGNSSSSGQQQPEDDEPD